jgi:Rieske Fe-S protein
MSREISREDSDMTEERPVGRTSRRTVLLGVGGVGTVAVIAACGSTASSGGGSGNGGAGNGGSGDGGSGNGGSGGDTSTASKDLGATSSIPVGGGKIFPDQRVVVTQPTAGAFKAFTAVCTHLGCTVNQVRNGLILCPCHGSEYSITDGSVKQGPAPSPLPTKQITVANDQITLG